MQDLPSRSQGFNPWCAQLHGEIPVPLPLSHCPWTQLGFWPQLSLCGTLRGLFPTWARRSKSNGWLGHTHSLRPEWGKAPTVGVCAKNLWRAHSGASPSQCPWRPPTTCMPLNTSASIPRQMTPLGAFLATEPLTDVSSDVSTQPTVVLFPDPIS